MIYFKKIENYKKFLAYRFIYIKIKISYHSAHKSNGCSCSIMVILFISSSRFGFYDALNISRSLASLSTEGVKSPTNFVQRL